jgi:hypothetical protein
MRELFDPCIDGVIELIQGQIQQVEAKRNRVKVRILLYNHVAVANYAERLLSRGVWRIAISARGTYQIS